MNIYVPVEAVLLHRLRQVSHSLCCSSQPGLNLWQVKHHLPVCSCVQGRRFLIPLSVFWALKHRISTFIRPTRPLFRAGLQGRSDRGDHRWGGFTSHRWHCNAHAENVLDLDDGDFGTNCGENKEGRGKRGMRERGITRRREKHWFIFKV